MPSAALAFDFPTGAITPHADSVIPAGWVACDGTAYDGTLELYKPLWLLIGVTYGGSGQSSFRVPSLGGRVPIGVKSTTSGSGVDGPVGAWDGASSVTLTGAQTGVPSHGHSSTWDGSTGDPGHAHTASFGSHSHGIGISNQNVYNKNANTTLAQNDGNGSPTTTDYAYTGVSMANATIGGVSIANVAAANAASAHTNTQPQLALTYLIKL